ARSLVAVSVIIRSQRRLDQIFEPADDGVVVEMRHVVERILDRRLEMLLRYLAILQGRVETRLEQRKQRPCDFGIAIEDGGDEALALWNAGLLQVASVGTQKLDLARAKIRRLDERC